MALTCVALTAFAQPGPVLPDQRPPAVTPIARLPLFFEAAGGPADGPAGFLARGRDCQVLLTPARADFVLRTARPTAAQLPHGRDPQADPPVVATASVRLDFLGASSQACLRGLAEMAGKLHYLTGADAACWRTDLPMFGRVQVENLYPGIDLVYYGSQEQLEYDFTVAPKVDPAAIALRFEGVVELTVDGRGDLVMKLPQGELRHHRPALYQLVGGVRQAVTGGYRLRDQQTVGFEVGRYDHDQPLVIDPVFSYSSYFGGNGGDLALSVKLDAGGNVYLAGQTYSTQFPFPIPPNGAQPVFAGGTYGDAFVAKLDPSGTNLIYYTYLGGSANDSALDLALDRAGNAYIVGDTQSPDFPTRNALYPYIGGVPDPYEHVYPTDGFVAELNTNGSALVFSTYLGGNGWDVADGVAVDTSGNIYVTGFGSSTDFPFVNPLPGGNTFAGGTYDAFVTKLGPRGTNFVYSTYLGGENLDEGQGIAADTNGFAYVTGYTASYYFPTTTNAWQRYLNGSTNYVPGYDAFVARFTPQGALVYSTYLGGYYNDYGYRITTDGAGYAYVTGPAASPNFPNTATNVLNLHTGWNPTNGVLNFDAFLTKLGPAGRIIYSALFGGTNLDVGWDVVVHPSGDAFVIGASRSTDFPAANTSDLLSAANAGGYDVFITAFNPDASALLYSGLTGGSGDDFGYGITVDAEQSIYIVGETFSYNFPLRGAPPLQTYRSGLNDAFIAKIRLGGPVLTLARAGANLRLQWPASAPEYALQAATNLTQPVFWAPANLSPVLGPEGYTVSVPATNDFRFFRLYRP